MELGLQVANFPWPGGTGSIGPTLGAIAGMAEAQSAAKPGSTLSALGTDAVIVGMADDTRPGVDEPVAHLVGRVESL